MATSSAIHTLIELATQETDEAAKRLGQAMRAGEEARQKLTLLQQYRDDYAARFQASVAAGLSASGYRNFQIFIDKLDSAIASQQQVVARGRAPHCAGARRLASQRTQAHVVRHAGDAGAKGSAKAGKQARPEAKRRARRAPDVIQTLTPPGSRTLPAA